VPPSVRTVTELPGLGLRRMAGPDGRDRPVRWVAVSELEDPTPFLDGGELLLSTGMRLPADDPAALAAYVDRLVDADVAAFGLGVGLTHDEVPAALVAAAEARDLPLLQVPADTAFIAVSKAVSALLGAEEYDAITRAFEAQRDLTRAALGARGPAAVAARLARHTGGWVLVLDASGHVLHAAPEGPGGLADERAADLHDEVAALRARGLLASSAVADAKGHVSLHPLGASGRVRGFLAVGTPAPLDRPAQSVVAVAVSLLSFVSEQDGSAGEAGTAQLQAATLTLLLAGAEPHTLPLEQLDWSWLPGHPLRVVVAGGTAVQRAAARRAVQAPGGHHRAVVDLADELVVLVPDDPAAVAEVSVLLADGPSGGSVVTSLDELDRGVREARQAMVSGRGPWPSWYGQLAADGLLAALDPDVARSLAATLLAPLEGRKGDLVASLTAWLSHHGQWDTAAADLGVHRHTLRYRMRRVEELLGRSLDDPDLRAELWVALRVRAQDVAVH
jgi:PucR family transcriptional regulator, purine catabolism regulatory protein